MRLIRLLLFALLTIQGSNLLARSDQDERLKAHQEKKKQHQINSSGSSRPEQLPNFPTDCDPFPIPTTPEGPSETYEIVDFRDEYSVTTWRYPCNDDFSWVIFTIDPVVSTEPFVCDPLDLITQGELISEDYIITQDPALEDSTFCEYVTQIRSFAVSMWNFNDVLIDLQGEFIISWDQYPQNLDITIPAYNTEDYGPNASPILNNQMALNGIFYDPANPGHGFDFKMHEYGFTIFYYGHTSSGQRLWLISDPHTEEVRFGEPFVLSMYEVVNGGFGNPQPPETFWGTLTVTVNDCDSGKATIDGLDGLISVDFTRLVGLEDTTCARGR